MRRGILVRALLSLALVVFGVVSPFVWASTAETWLEGIHDAESDDLVQATVSVEGVVGCPAQPIGHVTVTALVPSTDDSAPTPCGVPPRPSRAPPLAA